MRNNNNKGSRSNVNKHELVYGESLSNARDAPNVCLSFVLLFTIFIIVVTQTLVLQQSKNVTAKCTETLLPPPCIQFSLSISLLVNSCKCCSTANWAHIPPGANVRSTEYKGDGIDPVRPSIWLYMLCRYNNVVFYYTILIKKNLIYKKSFYF